MNVFVDNDIAVKMAQWELLNRFTLHLTKVGGAQLFCLRTLQYKFKLKEPYKAAEMLGSMAAVKQLTDFMSMCQPAKAHNQAVASALADIPGIDAGEVALFAAAANYDSALVDTGDKKAIRAMGALGSAHIAPQALASKLACLEQTMHYLVGRWSSGPVRDAVQKVPAADAVTFKCFQAQTDAQALAALQQHVDQLRTESAGTLCAKPFAWIA